MKLTPESAEYHYETGAFIIVSDLPEGSQVGIDGEDKVAAQFMGYKMIPSGLHLFTHSSPGTADAPMALPVRHGLFRTLRSRQTLVLKYAPEEEELIPNLADAQTGEEVETVLTREHLKTLDGNLGVYPLYRTKVWQRMTNCIMNEDVERVVGKAGKLDSLMESPADDEVVHGRAQMEKVLPTKDAKTLDFVAFDLKRSWSTQAVGEEVTRYSKDKTWLWRDVINTRFDSDPSRLLAEIQLAFVVFLYVQNFAGLLAYRRLLSLCARCEELFGEMNDDSPTDGVTLAPESIGRFYTSLVKTLETQVKVVPETFFTVELAGTGMEDFWLTEIETLIRNYGTHSRRGDVELDGAIGVLSETVRTRFGWDLPELRDLRRKAAEEEDEDELEEGEDAPVVVEL